MGGIGPRIREVRTTQGKSLNDIASRARISAATLSRIETEKQGVGISLFLVLAKALKVHPNELLGDVDSADANGELSGKVAGLSSSERARLWRELAAIHRGNGRAKRREPRKAAEITSQIEELLAQIDYLRQELDAIRLRVAGPKKPRR